MLIIVGFFCFCAKKKTKCLSQYFLEPIMTWETAEISKQFRCDIFDFL